MADELTAEQAADIVSNPANPDYARLRGPNGDGEGGDPVLKARVEAAQAKANPALAEYIRQEHTTYRPQDLKAQGKPDPNPVANPQMTEEERARLAEWRKENDQPASTNPVYDASKERFRESLGMDAGPEFESHVENLQSWVVDTFSSADEFDRLAAAAEEAFGVENAARLAIRLAGAHAKKKKAR